MLNNTTRVIPSSQLVATPWKNGGGTTREILCYPPGAGLDDFIWRVSIADVATAGPFSCFNGIERILVLLQGEGMVLSQSDGTLTVLDQPGQAIRFQGEAPISASLNNGPTRDFNLMTRRGKARGEVTVLQSPGDYPVQGDTVLLFCVAGEARVRLEGQDSILLGPEDTLQTGACYQQTMQLQGQSTLLLVTLFYQGDA